MLMINFTVVHLNCLHFTSLHFTLRSITKRLAKVYPNLTCISAKKKF